MNIASTLILFCMFTNGILGCINILLWCKDLISDKERIKNENIILFYGVLLITFTVLCAILF